MMRSLNQWDILTDAQPFTATIGTGAWRAFQEYLANMGSVRSKKPLVMTGFPRWRTSTCVMTT